MKCNCCDGTGQVPVVIYESRGGKIVPVQSTTFCHCCWGTGKRQDKNEEE
jgi:hypothetical protein